MIERPYQLVYVSSAAVDLTERELETILGSGRQHNAATGLTGLLVHVHDERAGRAWFVQQLEGNRDDVEQTYHRISLDELHSGVTVLHRIDSGARMFAPDPVRLVTLQAAEVRRRVRVPGGPLSQLLHDRSLVLALISSCATGSDPNEPGGDEPTAFPARVTPGAPGDRPATTSVVEESPRDLLVRERVLDPHRGAVLPVRRRRP
ncbi:BLUF domain-containing protein [Kineosporia succinea]|uniref:BLUF domain-containing protein n=1 Tax=Kineosporia succinea TaxID=84632 RepID=A0ABT9NX95_9ACTN|nr:BLUF domain-containing protein [Kineosporia succinea]MDP9825051.1 hypothetical protein [Kineosporia succinea]